MSNKNKAASIALRIARQKELVEEYQTRLHNDRAVYFTMQVKSQPKNKDISFQDWCEKMGYRKLNKRKK
jgi:hypothetical protein